MQTVNILGTEYKLIESDSGKDAVLKSADGYCDHTTKTLVIKDIIPETNSVGDLEQYKKRVIRHEVIHAFYLNRVLLANPGRMMKKSWTGLHISFPSCSRLSK